MKVFFQFINSLEKALKLKLLLFVFFIILNSLLEIISISFVIPVIEIITRDEISKINSLNLFMLDQLNLGKNSLVTISLIALSAIILKNFSFIYINFWQISFINKLEFIISKKIFKNYMSRDYNFFLKKNSSEIVRNLTTEVQHVIKAFFNFFTVLVEIILLFVLSAYLLLINFKITISIFFVVTLVGLIIYLIFKNKIKQWSELRVNMTAKYLKVLIQTFNSIKEIFVFKKKKEISDKHDTQKLEILKLNKDFSFVNIIPKPILEMVVFAILILTIIIFSKTENFFSYLTLYIVVLLRIYPAITRIIVHFQSFYFRLPSFKVIKKDFSLDNDKKNKNLIQLDKNFLKSEIKGEGLFFQYGDKKIINNLNFQLKVGKIYGIVGPSGSGKSTLLDILMGLKKQNSGKIIFDDKEINSELYNWFNIVGYVPQNAYLYDETILENIGFGIKKDQINLDQVNYSVDKSNLRDFVNSLPDGLNTIVGEKGVRISGGQIQRISIARALYHNPKLLILDEVTSQLDDKTENHIIKDLEILKRDKLILFVTHKKRLFNLFDEVIDLENK